MNLMSKTLPQCIRIGGRDFFVNADFRVWMRFCNDFEKWDQKTELEVSYLFTEEVPLIWDESDIMAVLKFAYPPAVVPSGTSDNEERILDYEIDGEYIYSAFLGQYGIDLLKEDMHWHRFVALLHGLNSSTRIREIMEYRSYEGNDKEYLKLKNAWKLPVVLTDADKQAKKEFDEYFG